MVVTAVAVAIGSACASVYAIGKSDRERFGMADRSKGSKGEGDLNG